MRVVFGLYRIQPASDFRIIYPKNDLEPVGRIVLHLVIDCLNKAVFANLIAFKYLLS